MGILNSKNDDAQSRELLKDVWEAWQDWQGAINYFENADGPEMVDFAIYNLEAKRRRYMVLVNKAKEKMNMDVEQIIYRRCKQH